MTAHPTGEREAVCARCKNRGTIPVMHGNALCPDCGGKSYREQPYTLADAVERSGPWGIATTIGGSVMLVDESDEGAPIATFAQGDDARRDAEAIAVILAHVRSVAATPPTASASPRNGDEMLRQHAERIAAQPDPEGQWRCRYVRSHGWPCNTLNELDDDSCGACGEPRPAPPREEACRICGATEREHEPGIATKHACVAFRPASANYVHVEGTPPNPPTVLTVTDHGDNTEYAFTPPPDSAGAARAEEGTDITPEEVADYWYRVAMEQEESLTDLRARLAESERMLRRVVACYDDKRGDFAPIVEDIRVAVTPPEKLT